VKAQSPAIYRRILQAVDACPARGATKLVAIDGRGGSGKTRLAAELMSIDGSLKLLSVDHFPCWGDEYPYHPTGVQTRISEARLLKALLPLSENAPAAYRRSHWWETDRIERLTRVEPGWTVLVEGCYSLLPSLRPLYDFSIWVECPYERALARAMARDEVDEVSRAGWEFGHAPNQERYIETHRPSEFADMAIVSTQKAGYEILRR